MKGWASFKYRDFYDVPRMLIVHGENSVFLFDSRFDDTKDDYDKHYEVYLMPRISEERLRGDWRGLHNLAIRHLGRVSVGSVEFDRTKRKELNLAVISHLCQNGSRPLRQAPPDGRGKEGE